MKQADSGAIFNYHKFIFTLMVSLSFFMAISAGFAFQEEKGLARIETAPKTYAKASLMDFSKEMYQDSVKIDSIAASPSNVDISIKPPVAKKINFIVGIILSILGFLEFILRLNPSYKSMTPLIAILNLVDHIIPNLRVDENGKIKIFRTFENSQSINLDKVDANVD